MASRTLKYGSNALVFVVVVFAILALINFLSTRRFARADLTENQRYTISPSTKKILKRLDDIVTINAYFSQEPARVAQIRRDVRDVLDEYRAYSNRNLQINFIDPADNPDMKQKLQLMGIPEVQINVIEKDKAEVANVYLGIAVLYADKKEVLPVVQNTSNLEYDLTSAVLKVTSKEIKTVGFLAGHNELDIDAQPFEPLRQQLSKQYRVRKVEIKNGQAIDNDIATLVIAGPKGKLTEREKYEIDQFIMRGGRAVFLIDPIRIEGGTLQGMPLATGLNDLLEHYGVKFGNNLVLDVYHDNASFRQGFITYSLPYPYWIKVLKEYRDRSGSIGLGFSKESIITSQLESLTLPWASSLELLSPSDKSIEMTALVQTSKHSWTVQSPYNLDPNNRVRPPSSAGSAYTVAASLSGVFKSFYAGKAIPPVEPGQSSGSTSPLPAGGEGGVTNGNRTTTPESQPTQLVVVGNSAFLEQGRPDGQIFFLNTIDWLTLGEDLINIRSHDVMERPLREVSESEKGFIRFVCTFGIPLIVVAFGLLRFFLRRRAKRLVEAYGTV